MDVGIAFLIGVVVGAFTAYAQVSIGLWLYRRG